VVQKISYVEITSTCSAAASCGCRSSGVLYAVDSATLQPVHRRTPAPYGMLAVPAVLPAVPIRLFVRQLSADELILLGVDAPLLLFDMLTKNEALKCCILWTKEPRC